ncbi:MAG: hypothetical protein IT375_01790 [Polyangiaceae bacterium]|nr:hypothetical protein [Polyangiaceae bacterium]
MGQRWFWGAGLALSLALGSAPASADVTPEKPKVAAKPAANRRPIASRPVLVGLLAALFLIVAGAAGANDKHKKS